MGGVKWGGGTLGCCREPPALVLLTETGPVLPHTDLRRPCQKAGAVFPPQGPLLPPRVRQPLPHLHHAAEGEEEDHEEEDSGGHRRASPARSPLRNGNRWDCHHRLQISR